MKTITFLLLFSVSLAHAVPVPSYPQLQPQIYTDDITTFLRARAVNSQQWMELMHTFEKQKLPHRLKRRVVHFFSDFVILDDFVRHFPELPAERPSDWPKPIWPNRPGGLPWWARDIPMSRDRDIIIRGLAANLTQSTFHMVRAIGKASLPLQEGRAILIRTILARIDQVMNDQPELREKVRAAFTAAGRDQAWHSRRHQHRVVGTSLGLMGLVALASPLLGSIHHFGFDPTGSLDIVALEALLLIPPIYTSWIENRRAEVRNICNEFWNI
jgi:hypothetical protein